MRPCRLTIRALGPYADEVEIDFDRLMRAGIFLIHGTTGAGKTFLLDAMCFALYGEVPGERGKHTLRTQHAGAGTDSAVILEFSAQGRNWRVERTPAYERPRKHGDGTTRVAATAGLWVEGANGWQPLASKIDDVNDQVSSIVGLDARRFQQVIMLPQGRFEQVLRSKSEDREELLRSLFDTSAFAGASEWLAERAKESLCEVDEAEAEAGRLRSRASQEWVSVMGEPEPTVTDQESFASLAAQCKAALADSEHAVGAASDSAALARNNHLDTQRLVRLWDQRDSLLAKHSQLRDDQERIDAMRARIQENADAESLRDLLDGADRSREAEQDCARAAAKALIELRTACEATPLLPPSCEAIVQGDDPSDADWDSMRSSIEESRAIFSAHREAALEAAQSEATARLARERETQHRGEEASSRSDAESARERIDSLSTELVKSQEAASKTERLAEQLADLEGTAAVAEELAERRCDLEAASTALQETTTHALEQRECAVSLREQYVAGIASALASELVDGAPCSVCGSKQHPSPASAQAEAPDIGLLREAEQSVDVSRAAQNAAEKTLREITAHVSRLEGEAGEFAEDLEAVERLVAERRAELEETTALAQRSGPMSEAREVAQRELAEHEASADQAARRVGLASEQASAAEQVALSIRSRIMADLGDVDPGVALRGIEQVRAALAHATTLRRALLEAETSARAASEMLAQAIARSDFADEQGVRAALMAPTDASRASALVDQHDRESTEVDIALASEEFIALPITCPDADASEAALAAAESSARESAERRALVDKASQDINRWAEQHAETSASLDQARRQADLWGAVSDRCNGKVAPKVSLQRWVLSAYLSEICGCANQRLATMTAGRYSLRVYGGTERHSAKAGLGLRVFDAHTGREREVQTLSGGETFQASLALALGVADVVSRHSGGVRMETIFVDEGFGTLDAESLQTAMDELDRLREGGRAVGIISHIPGLRERVQVGIEVTASEKGSRVQVGAVRAA